MAAARHSPVRGKRGGRLRNRLHRQVVVEALLAREGERGSRPTGRRDGREGGLRPVEEMEGRASDGFVAARALSAASAAAT